MKKYILLVITICCYYYSTAQNHNGMTYQVIYNDYGNGYTSQQNTQHQQSMQYQSIGAYDNDYTTRQHYQNQQRIQRNNANVNNQSSSSQAVRVTAHYIENRQTCKMSIMVNISNTVLGEELVVTKYYYMNQWQNTVHNIRVDKCYKSTYNSNYLENIYTYKASVNGHTVYFDL